MTLRAPRRIAAVLAVPALLAGGVAAAAPGAEAATGEPTYKGSSMALSVKVNLAGSSLLDEVLPGLVTYPPGAKTSLLELPEELSELVTLKVLNASSGVNDGVLESNAHTASLGVLGEVITARVLNADCTSNAGDTSGDSQVAGLALAGTKVPVDPGPNVKIEIPDALAALVKGSIVIDEQVPVGDGGTQVRALHINLVVAPAAIEDALNSVIATVRETAEQLKVVVEEVTGKSLDQLVGVAKAEKAQQAEKAAKAKAAPSSKKGAQNADRAEVRASAAAPAAPAAAETPAEAAAPAAPAAGAEKTDGADVEGEALAEEQAEAESVEEAEEAAAAERAERAAKGSKADQDVPAEESGSTELSGDVDASETAQSSDPAVVAEEARPAAPAPAPVPAPAKAKEKAAPSDLPLLDKVQAAIPAADSIAGALGLDIIVSQVTCEGAPGVAEVKQVNRPEQLPGTGGNGDAVRNVAVAGLGLLLAGGTAVGLTRRRRAIV